MEDSALKFDNSGLSVGSARGSSISVESRRQTRHVGRSAVRVPDPRLSRRGARRPVMSHIRTSLRVRPLVVGALPCASSKGVVR